MKERMQRLLSLCAQFMGLLYLIPVVSSQHHLCIRPVSCDHGSVLPDPDDCQAYFECNDRRRWEQQRCSNSQRFDVVQMACIKKNQARCLDCSFTTPSVVDETAACSPPVPCVLDSVLGNPDSCASYQMCFTERNWRVFDCPDGQLFDILSSQCVDSNQEEYICQPSCVFLTPRIDSNDRNNPNPNVASTSPFIRTIEPDILDTACGIVEGESCPIMDHAFPDVNDCEYFYLCTGIWRRLRCAEVPDSNGHDYYDAVSGQCRTIDMERTCAAPCSTTAMPTTTSSPAPTIDPVILERACNVSDRDSCTENAEYLPNPADCGSFFFCLIRTWKKISCTNGQHFDALSDNTCKDPDLAMCAPPCPTEPIPTTTSSPPTSTVTSTATSTTTETSTTMQEITHTQTEELTTTDPQNPTTFAETTTIQSTTQPPITQPSTPPVPTSTTDTSLLTTPTSTIPSTTQPSTPTLPTSTVITTPPIVTPSTVPRITTQPSTPPIPPSPTTPPIVTPSTVPRFTTQPSTPSQPTTRTTVTSSTTTPSTTSTTTQPLTPAETVPTTTTTPPSSTVPPTTIPSTSMESSTTQSPTTTLPSTSTASITTSETTESSTTQSPTTTSPSTSTASITTRETTQPSTTVIYTSEEPTTLETPPTTIPPTSHEPSTSNMVTTMPTDPTSTVPPEVTTSDARSSETPVTSPTTTEQYLFTTTLSGGEETSPTSYSSAWPELTAESSTASATVTSDSHYLSEYITTAVVANASQYISFSTTDDMNKTPYEPTTEATTVGDDVSTGSEVDQSATTKGIDPSTESPTTTTGVLLTAQSSVVTDEQSTESSPTATRLQLTTSSATSKVVVQSTEALTSSVPDDSSTDGTSTLSTSAEETTDTTSEPTPSAGDNGITTDLLSQTTTDSPITEDPFTYPSWVFTPIVEPPRLYPSPEPILTTVLHGASGATVSVTDEHATGVDISYTNEPNSETETSNNFLVTTPSFSETTLDVMATRNSHLTSRIAEQTFSTRKKDFSTMEVRDHTQSRPPDQHSETTEGTSHTVVENPTTVSIGTTTFNSDDTVRTSDNPVTSFGAANTVGSGFVTLSTADMGDNATSSETVSLTTQSNLGTTEIVEYCAAVVEAGVTVWPETLVGTVARSEVCRPEQEGYVSRQCVETLSGGAAWADPDFGMCVDRVYQELLHEAEHLVKDSSSHGGFNATAVLILAEELEQLSANATSAPGGMTPGNLNVTVEAISLLGEITEMGSGNGTTTGSIEDDMLEEIVQEVIETVSIVVSPENADGWSELLEMDPNRAVSILSVVDGVALQVAQIAEPGADISFVTNTIVVEVYPMDADETETLVFEGMVSMSADDQPQVDTIAIPMMTLANIAEEMDMDTIVVYGTYYNTLGMYMPTGDLILNSNIMALSVKDLPFGTHLHPPVEMNFTLLNQSIEDATVMCAYWNYTSRTSGYWSSEGCTLKQYSLSRASCQCNHLTNFAVLMSPYRPAAHHVQILSLITIVGCLLSIVGCFATLCLYVIAWKRIASEHAAVMLNLCVVLILANGLFLAGIERTENWIACTSVAALLHYLYLTACMVMLADGIEFVLYVMYVFHVKRRKETVLLLATCYVVPATIVGISLSVTKLHGYGTDEYCWLAKENGLLAAFIGPVVLITLANFIILIKVLQTAAGSKAREHKGKFWSTIWNVTVILPLLGITWVFGVIAINEDTVYFQYVFATLNSLQGFFIFIFHCALNKKLREAVIAKFSSRGSTTSSMRSGKSAKSKKSTTSNLSDKSGKSDKKNFLSRKKKDSDTKGGKGKPKLKGTQQNYVNGDIENAVYSEYITPSRAAAQNGYVQEVSGENDLYCDIIEANMNPKNDLNKGIRWHYDKSPFSTRSDRFVKVDDRKAFERASITSVKSYEKKDVAEEFLIMEPEYIDENREIHFIDNRAFFDDTESDSQYMEIDNLEDSASVNQWTRYQINHSGDESNVQQPQHWIRYQISNNDPNYVNDVNGPPEYMNGIA